VRCGRCGNENVESNRFCGMCGAPLTPKTQQAAVRHSPSVPPGNMAPPRSNVSGATVRESQAQVPSALQPGSPARPIAQGQGPMTQMALSSPDPAFGGQGSGLASAPNDARPPAPFDDDAAAEPTISGPSFLGLNQPAPRRTASRHESRADGGHLQASGNLDYLLEDDEEEPKRGWGKAVFILVALALAAGFGYLRWKQGGFDWLTAGRTKPAAIQPAADAAQKPPDNGGTEPSAATGTASNPGSRAAAPSGTALPSGSATPNTNAANPAPVIAPMAGAAQPSPGTAPAAIPPGTASPIPSQLAPATNGSPQNPATNNAPATSGASEQTGGSQNSSEATTPAGTASPVAGGVPQSSEETQPPPAATASRRTPSKPLAPKPSPPKPADSVTEAQRYIYGRGVRQDCDRGLHMLKSAADHSDAKAMISLGALYSTGATCTPRDLPTAYRYFAMGLHKEPDNQALQDDLQKLWSQMTQPERQLAIKLSQ
jgi:zinc-ribbon domain